MLLLNLTLTETYSMQESKVVEVGVVAGQTQTARKPKILLVGMDPDEVSVKRDRTCLNGSSYELYFLNNHYIEENAENEEDREPMFCSKRTKPLPSNCYNGDFNDWEFMQDVFKIHEHGKFDLIIIDFSTAGFMQVGTLKMLTKFLKLTGSLFIQDLIFFGGLDGRVFGSTFDKRNVESFRNGKKFFFNDIFYSTKEEFEAAVLEFFRGLLVNDTGSFRGLPRAVFNDELFCSLSAEVKQTVGLFNVTFQQYCREHLSCSCQIIMSPDEVPDTIRSMLHREYKLTKSAPLYQITPITTQAKEAAQGEK